MTKVPTPGRVKTRLGPVLDETSAARLSACFLKDMAGALEAAFPGLCRVAYTPAAEGERLRALVGTGCPLIPQRGANLSDRLYNLFHYLLIGEGLDSALALNSDTPTLPMALVADGFARLEEPGVDGVVGPTKDGGYYLIGLAKPHKHLFSDIPWSTPEVLGMTLRRAEEAHLRLELLEPWYDVDDPETLLHLWQEFEDGAGAEKAPATRAYLQQLHAEGRLGRIC